MIFLKTFRLLLISTLCSLCLHGMETTKTLSPAAKNESNPIRFLNETEWPPLSHDISKKPRNRCKIRIKKNQTTSTFTLSESIQQNRSYNVIEPLAFISTAQLQQPIGNKASCVNTSPQELLCNDTPIKPCCSQSAPPQQRNIKTLPKRLQPEIFDKADTTPVHLRCKSTPPILTNIPTPPNHNHAALPAVLSIYVDTHFDQHASPAPALLQPSPIFGINRFYQTFQQSMRLNVPTLSTTTSTEK